MMVAAAAAALRLANPLRLLPFSPSPSPSSSSPLRARNNGGRRGGFLVLLRCSQNHQPLSSNSSSSSDHHHHHSKLILEVKEKLQKEYPGLATGKNGRDDEEMILWFLKDRKFSVEEAVSKLNKAIKWRQEFGVTELSEESVKELYETGKAYVHDHLDKNGRPVLVVVGSKHLPAKQDPVMNQKLCVLLLERALSRLPPGTDNILGIFDLRGFGIENGDLEFLKFLIDVFYYYYPKRLGQVLFVDAPFVFQPMWQIVKPLLKSYASLVRFCNAETVRKEYFTEDTVPPDFKNSFILRYRYQKKLILEKMEGLLCRRLRFSRIIALIQVIIGLFVIFISMASLHRFYNASSLLHFSSREACHKFDAITEGILREGGYAPFDLKALSERIDEVLSQLAELQEKLESTALKLGKSAKKDKSKKLPPAAQNITLVEFKRFLEEEVIRPLYDAHIALRLTRVPRPEDAVLGAHSGALMEDPLVNYFTIEETRKYITAKVNRDDMVNLYGTNKTYNTIGHACVLMKKELDKYMNYDVGSYCGDDWDLGQQLMIGGCDPLPRRRCLARASKLYQRPLAINESMWTIPDNGNVRWGRYKCRDFKCLSYKNPKRGYNKCVGCFDMDKEKLKWVSNGTTLADFKIKDVLQIKPGEIRIGLDVSVTTGTFAARMREHNVTIVSTALNLGAPFSETIALRGLIPLYTTMSQRLPFFDNTMDMIHTSNFLDGWIDLQLMDFVLFDWDRVLRPGGLLWVDKFSCLRRDLDDYMYMFLQFRYKKHKWVVSFKSKKEVYLSALLEKPPRTV